MNKEKTYQVVIQTIDIIEPDQYFENSYEWSGGYYCDETVEYYKDEFIKFIPKDKQNYLDIESINDQFEDDIKRTVSYAYTCGLKNDLHKKIESYIYDTLQDSIDQNFTITWDNSTSIVWSENITLTFNRNHYVSFQKSRTYEINYTTFEEEIVERILYNKRKFRYNDLYAGYHWDDTETLKRLFNDYQETTYLIDKLIKTKNDLIKTCIKNKIPLIYRQQKLDKIA